MKVNLNKITNYKHIGKIFLIYIHLNGQNKTLQIGKKLMRG